MRRPNRLTITFVLLAAIYTACTFSTPTPLKTLHQYHITAGTVRIIDLCILLPLFAIWGTAFYGYQQLSNYTDLIKKNRDGQAMNKISWGLLFLALWLPVSGTFSAVMKYVMAHSGASSSPLLISYNYVALVLPFVGFLCIAYGARGLSEISKQRPSQRATNVLAFLVIGIGVLYSRLISTTSNRLSVPYHLSASLVLATLAVPYIFMWFQGLLATYEIYNYRRKVEGILYGKSVALLAYGLGALLFTSILIQCLTTLSYRLTPLSLNWILVVIYVLLIILALSFALIAWGAKRLKKIEEV